LGIAGGVLVVLAFVAAMLASGGFDTSSRTITVVQEMPATPGNAADGKGGASAHEIYERDAPGVVSVSVTGVGESPSAAELVKGEGGELGTSSGSGFEIDDSGLILTNWHVVAGGEKVVVSLGASNETIKARIVGKDPSHDLAVLRIPAANLTLRPLRLGSSSDAEVGDAVLAIGNPFGYARTLTAGLLSAVGRRIQVPSGGVIDGALQTDASIDPGSSGGPLLNYQGEVIGIVSQIVSLGSNGGNAGVNFAIPIDTAKLELPALERGR
jgi:S1-C subfamily serine protease